MFVSEKQKQNSLKALNRGLKEIYVNPLTSLAEETWREKGVRIDLDTLPENVDMKAIVEHYRKTGFVVIHTKNDLGWALQQMKQGHMVCRAAWWENSCMFLIKGRSIEYNKFQSFKNNAGQAFDPPQDIEIEDHIDAKHNGKYITGFTPNQSDLLAEDWEIYKVEK